jgi:hypothetical protein
MGVADQLPVPGHQHPREPVVDGHPAGSDVGAASAPSVAASTSGSSSKTASFIHSCFSGMAVGTWQAYKSVRTLSKASCISTAVEKRSSLAGAHAFMRNCASSALRSGRIVLGSITGS